MTVFSTRALVAARYGIAARFRANCVCPAYQHHSPAKWATEIDACRSVISLSDCPLCPPAADWRSHLCGVNVDSSGSSGNSGRRLSV